MKTKQANYLYNFYNKDDGDGSPIIVDINGFQVQIGINVVILPGFHILPCPARSGQITVVGSDSFLGKDTSLEEGSVSPNGTILQGKQLFEKEINTALMLVGDDFGRRHEANSCIIHCFKNQMIHHASLMVNCPPSKEAAELINDYALHNQVGLHFNVQDGDALAKCKRENHYDMNVPKSFAAQINSRRAAFFLTMREKKLLQDELKQQIQAFKSTGAVANYFDSHGNIHFKWPVAKTIYKTLLEEGFQYVRVPRSVPSHHKLYDYLFKRRVTKLYKRYFETSDEFLNASDLFSPDIVKYKNHLIEVMAHPFLKNGHFINRRDVSFPVLLAYFRACGISLVTNDCKL